MDGLLINDCELTVGRKGTCRAVTIRSTETWEEKESVESEMTSLVKQIIVSSKNVKLAELLCEVCPGSLSCSWTHLGGCNHVWVGC